MVRTALLIVAAVGATLIGAPPTASAQPYETCKQAADHGVYNIPSSSPDYGPWLDSDGDGVGCEKK